MHSYIVYIISRPPKVIVRRGHKIMLNLKKKKKKKGSSTTNKYSFKDGPDYRAIFNVKMLGWTLPLIIFHKCSSTIMILRLG